MSNDNPLLQSSGLPKFKEISHEHIEPALTIVLDDALSKLEALETNIVPSWEGLITPLEEIGKPFEYAWGPVGHLLNVKNSDELRTEHEKIQPKVVEFSLRMGQSKPIYDSLVEIRDGNEWNRLDDAQKRVIVTTLSPP